VENTVTMNNLAVLASHLGDLPRAEGLLRRCVTLRRRGYGDEHALTRGCVRSLDRVQRALAEGRAYTTLGTEDAKSEG
jgi:hypothetical protein